MQCSFSVKIHSEESISKLCIMKKGIINSKKLSLNNLLIFVNKNLSTCTMTIDRSFTNLPGKLDSSDLSLIWSRIKLLHKENTITQISLT